MSAAAVVRTSIAFVLALTAVATADDDLTIDECAQPGAQCQPESTTLDADEAADAQPDDPIAWPTGEVACAEGSSLVDGACVPEDLATDAAGGCAASWPGAFVGIAALAILIVARRRRRLLAIAIAAACTTDEASWDDVVDAGATGDASRVDVFAAQLGDTDGARYLLASQRAPMDHQPVAQFSLSSARGAKPILRSTTPCGDRLGNTGDELLGWARDTGGEGSAELVELISPEGCYTYETDVAAIDARVAAGYAIESSIGYVWPPGLGDTVVDDPDVVAAKPCVVTKASPWFLLYASPGADESERFLTGCPGEVIIGEKHLDAPSGRMRLAANHDRGGRTALVLDRHGDKLRELLSRTNGVERTAQYIRNKLAAGYDYIVIDEITASSDWADGGWLNEKFRKLLLRIPPRTMIGYISIDLTQYASGFSSMKARRYLLRALKQRGRGIALEVYLHTASVMAGRAPSAFRLAADRLALSVSGMKHGGGINQRAAITIGTSMHSSYPQYRYLDQPGHDLDAIGKQVNAIRHGGKRLRQQKGVGFYFVNKSDMAPPSAYTYDRLIRTMRLQTLKF